MTLKEFYSAIGGDYNELIQRFGSEALILRFVNKFPDEKSFPSLLSALESKDGELSFRSAHDLKGIALNLGFASLLKPLSALTDALRAGWNEEAPSLLPPVEEAYEAIVTNIRKGLS